jgi:[ribosomal protein S5]-alanine N-acetyltransferase
MRFPHLPLRTPRLLLRPPAADDADALFAIHADPEVMRYWSFEPWTSREQAVQQVERDARDSAGGSSLRLLLQPAGGGPIRGAVSLFAIDGQSRRAQVGYILARDAWGSGLMAEALPALVGYAIDVVGLRRLEADIDPRNARSSRLLEQVSDTALYGLLAREWHACRTSTT